MTDIIISTENAEAAKSRFADLTNQRRLMNESAPGAIAASRVFAYVMGREDADVKQVLQSNLSIRRIYRTLLKQNAYFHIPQALAASSEDYPERHGDGCIIRLQASRAQEDQLYLIIELADQRRDMPHTLSVFGAGDEMETLDLPAARNGVIQTIIDKNANLANLLADPKTETFLR
ncbi:hypothetical protein RYZ26_02010 [Terasakiella sp. A23]|uniref:hypothetical protein n=1 Tax=Terasakiella sp. FCG-A23 TaxID=3080561 RepID=UPI0029552BC8|nr:hypothetical protein [Terasakiella sp. A23]MDV7338353.1 hypothetical protein [Terasakiella sp. A23]